MQIKTQNFSFSYKFSKLWKKSFKKWKITAQPVVVSKHFFKRINWSPSHFIFQITDNNNPAPCDNSHHWTEYDIRRETRFLVYIRKINGSLNFPHTQTYISWSINSLSEVNEKVTGKHVYQTLALAPTKHQNVHSSLWLSVSNLLLLATEMCHVLLGVWPNENFTPSSYSHALTNVPSHRWVKKKY